MSNPLKPMKIYEILSKKISIPVVQRSFKYNEDFLTSIWGGIYEEAQRALEHLNDGYYFFTACFLDRDDGYYEIYDGQQRIFSICLALKATYEVLGSAAKEKIDLAKQLGDRYNIFQENYKSTKKTRTKYDDALDFFREKIKEIDNKDLLICIAQALKNSEFSVIIAKNLDEAANYFDKMNQVTDFTPGERAKNVVWGYFQNSLECDERWSNIEKQYGDVVKNSTDLFLVFLRNYRSPVESNNLNATLTSVLSERFAKEDLHLFFDIFENTAMWLSYLKEPERYEKKSSNVRRFLNLNKRYFGKISAHHALLVYILRALDGKAVDSGIFYSLVRLLGSALARAPIRGGNPIKQVGNHFSKFTHNGQDNSIDVKGDWIKKLCCFLLASPEFQEDKSVFENVVRSPLKNWSNFEKLYLDVFLKEKHGEELGRFAEGYSVEHIEAKKYQHSAINKIWICSIGNLMYIDSTLNSKMQNSSFESKRNTYLKKTAGREPNRIALEHEHWTEMNIIDRQEEVMRAFDKEFPRLEDFVNLL